MRPIAEPVAATEVSLVINGQPVTRTVPVRQLLVDFIRDELGDMRSFSLDSPQSRLPRIDQLRAAQPA